jgi:hypothetical protein
MAWHESGGEKYQLKWRGWRHGVSEAIMAK